MTLRRITCAVVLLSMGGCFKAADDAGDEIADTGTDSTGESDTTTGGDTTTESDTTTTGSDTTTGEDPFVFADEFPNAYTRVDRMAMPAIATAVITSKDAYNKANPVDDAAAMFVDEISMNVSGLHAALDDDITAVGLIPCAVATCMTQAGPLVVPDTLKIDLTNPPGFPNGRRLPDPVIDVTLAVIALDLAAMGQDATTLANVPLNPSANDVAFLPDFPYLAAPN